MPLRKSAMMARVAMALPMLAVSNSSAMFQQARARFLAAFGEQVGGGTNRAASPLTPILSYTPKPVPRSRA